MLTKLTNTAGQTYVDANLVVRKNRLAKLAENLTAENYTDFEILGHFN